MLEAAYSKMYTALTPDGPNKGSDVSEETTAKYYEMWNKSQEGNIDEQEWQSFCVDLLGDLMEANKDVFVRLKNR